MDAIVYYVLGTLIVGVIVWLRTKQPAGSLQTAFDQFQSALDVAPDVVRATEQLWLTGELQKDGRLDFALLQLSEWFPALDETQLRTAVEFGVFAMKQAIDVVQIELPGTGNQN